MCLSGRSLSALTNASLLQGSSSSLPVLPYESPNSRERLTEAANKRERHDGRRFEEMRAMCMQTHSLAAAAGSAFVSVGKTKLNCAVYGPRPNMKHASQDRGSINLEFRFAPFATTGKDACSERDTAHLTTLLHQALNAVVRLDLYAKSTIAVSVLVLEDDGGLISAALTCIGLALADAGIEMLDVVTGASACVFSVGHPDSPPRTCVLLDPDAEERRAFADKNCTFVDLGYCPALASVCFIRASGTLLATESGEQMLRLCEAACYAVADEVRSCLRRSFCLRQEEKRDRETPQAPVNLSPPSS
ncbi:3' exoribonuclease family, domain 1 domain-containing protein [Toxoplasma gondii VEG]|uniref:3' exoribonuclease family, domain 1 domain-containing protein n=11 Tax=Toxoplasma gondii TaxID=5811 RepID=B9QI93_TOXGV|nr:3' exoribonuclease family, domain 1 domain-containing protein [Toxoplasma gondii VEG]KFG43701.1 3' exoribonuclease family, domain 1 domain-containing protein [Toxoplasma gondii p89]CEL72489.1 TPA: 3' exoribonuclease, putative [Toxoplasma gondii VEG]